MIKTKDVRRKILNFIENEDIKDIIEWAIKICKHIFFVMVIILLGFIFMPSIKGGWLDRNTMISSVSTLISGLFGLIAGIIGIVATYGAFYIGVKTEKEKVEKEKEEQVKFELSVLQKLLEHTLDETSMLASIIVDTYVKFYKKHDILEILHYRCYENDLVFERMLEELIIEDSLIQYRNIAKDYIKLIKGKFKSNDEFFSKIKAIGPKHLTDLYYDIQSEFSKYGDFKKLVYTGDWDKYMLHLKGHEKYTYTAIKDIINWMTFLTNNSLEEDNKRVNNLEDNRVILESNIPEKGWINTAGVDLEIKDIKLNQITTIMKFIEYRNNVIDVLETMFDGYEIENDILSSDEEIKNTINYEEWAKKMNLD